ncbi:MAG: helix-turn-helix transcriptional regulator [Magnetococcus sp. MYC-9]
MTPLSQEWFLDVVGEIYQAVLDLSRLTDSLEKLMQGFTSDSAMLRLQYHTDLAVGFNIYFGYEAVWREAYNAHFRQLDPYPNSIKPLPLHMYACDEAVPTRQLLKTEYYNDFLRPQGKLYCMGGHIIRNEQYFVQLGFQRGAKAEPFREEEIRALDLLAPHLQRVLTLNQHFSDLSNQKQMSELAFGCMPYGIILFEENLKPVFVNHVAEEILAGDAGLKLTAQGLETPIPAESRRLQGMIRQGLQLAAGKGLMEKNGMLITPQHADRRPIHGVVVPLRPEFRKLGFLTPIPRVLLFLGSLDHAPAGKNGSLLKNLFGLTQAETYLANALAAGRDLDEIALAKGCTRNTLRNQLKVVFSKTGTHRQAELVRLLAMLPHGV